MIMISEHTYSLVLALLLSHHITGLSVKDLSVRVLEGLTPPVTDKASIH